MLSRVLRLNLRVFRLALAHKWLSKAEFAESYDHLASDYDSTWLKHLCSVTDQLLSRLPQIQPGRILDLGCGTGYTTAHLAGHYPDHPLTAVDISENMLDQARKRLSGQNTECVHADMLEYMLSQPTESVSMIVSGWAIGYSKPDRLVKEVARVLTPGGTFAFVVNYADTLRPIFLTFQKCMFRFPEKVTMAYIPHFPKNWAVLGKMLQRHGFSITWHDEGEQVIIPPEHTKEDGILSWLLKTGVLAGFDQMLPLTEHGEVTQYFEQLLQANKEPITHHYVMVVTKRI